MSSAAFLAFVPNILMRDRKRVKMHRFNNLLLPHLLRVKGFGSLQVRLARLLSRVLMNDEHRLAWSMYARCKGYTPDIMQCPQVARLLSPHASVLTQKHITAGITRMNAFVHKSEPNHMCAREQPFIHEHCRYSDPKTSSLPSGPATLTPFCNRSPTGPF